MSFAGVLAGGKTDARELIRMAFKVVRLSNDDVLRTNDVMINGCQPLANGYDSHALGIQGNSATMGDLALRKVGAFTFLAGNSPIIQKNFLNVPKNHHGSNTDSKLRDQLVNELTKNTIGYALVGINGEGLFGIRDPIGQRPLFFGRTHSCLALSSCRKILWALGTLKTLIFPPGVFATFQSETTSSWRFARCHLPPIGDWSSCVASKVLVNLLCRSVRIAVGSANNVGILFSGGLDSLTIASTTKLLGLKTKLYTTAFEESRFLHIAEKAAEDLDLDLHTELIDREKLEQTIEHAIWSIETSNPLQVSVALPIDVAARAAVHRGEKILLTGSGADELFGGYARYPKMLQTLGNEGLQKMMFQDVCRLEETDLLRDGAVGEFNRVQLYAPFLDRELVCFALGLPTSFKVKNARDMLRKHILRSAAQEIGIPQSICYIPKKAAQYSSGSFKAIRKLSKSKGLDTKEYLNSILDNVRDSLLQNAQNYA